MTASKRSKISRFAPSWLAQLAGLCVGLSQISCAAGPRPTPASAQSAVADDARAAPSSQAAALWARRAERAQLEAAIAQLSEDARATDSRGAAAATQLANAHLLMGESILALGWAEPAQAARHFALGSEAAIHALARSAASAAAAVQQERAPAASELRTPGDAPSAYWLAANVYAGSQLAGFAELVTHEALVRGVLERCIELAPELDGGGAQRLLAALYAHPVLPAMRDLAKARALTDDALSRDRNDLRNALAYVEHYAVPAQDAAAAHARLDALLAASASSAEDRIALARAKALAAALEGRLE